VDDVLAFLELINDSGPYQ